MKYSECVEYMEYVSVWNIWVYGIYRVEFMQGYKEKSVGIGIPC